MSNNDRAFEGVSETPRRHDQKPILPVDWGCSQDAGPKPAQSEVSLADALREGTIILLPTIIINLRSGER